MKKMILALPLLLAACGTPGGGLDAVVSTGMQLSDTVCNEGSAISLAATSAPGLSTAAAAGIAAGTVIGKVGRLNGYLQAYCTASALAVPIGSAIAHQIMTASAQVLATKAAPPALVAAAKSGKL